MAQVYLNFSRYIDLLYTHRTTSPQICNRGPTWLAPSLPSGIDGDLRSSAPPVVVVWVGRGEDYNRDSLLLLLVRQQKLAPSTQEKLLLLDHHVTLVVVPVRDPTVEAETSAGVVLDSLGIRKCRLRWRGTFEGVAGGAVQVLQSARRVDLQLPLKLDVLRLRHQRRIGQSRSQGFGGESNAMVGDEVGFCYDVLKDLVWQSGEKFAAICRWHAWITAQ